VAIKVPVKKAEKQEVLPPENQVVRYRISGINKDDAFPTGVNPGKAVQSNLFQPEDEYLQFYLGGVRSVGAILPPYDLRHLDRLCQENNALSHCVEAMVTNVDGTGYDIIKPGVDSNEDEIVDDPIAQQLKEFFAEPTPGESFTTMRKKLRRDHERTGNAYVEIVRNAKDEIVLMRHADSKMMRLVKLDDPKPQKVTMRRFGKDQSITIMTRYRRFVQLVNGVQLRWFKELGCPLDLNKYNGTWAKPGERLPAQQRATEMLHFQALPDAHTPYGVPRWISQLPSVLGSRKAEELNLDFFDNGGVPPVLILLQGGVLAAESRKAVEQGLTGPAQKKNRVKVIEMEPNGGMIGDNPTTKVTVERFGAERQNDSMFEKYDERCEIRIRRGFRLPPIFVGQAADYSFATAFASYTVAEAQVFRPERDEFDETISVKLIPALGDNFKGYRMRSKPLVMDDATIKLQGIEIAQATGQIDASEVMDAVNEVSGLKLKVSKTLPPPIQTANGPAVVSVPGGNSVARGGRAGVKVNRGNGQQQSNSEKPKPKAIPRKSPAVSKEDEIAALAQRTLDAIENKDIDVINECFENIRKMEPEDAEELQFAIQDVLLTAATNVVPIAAE
jgi:PBSX family phage portal protein